MPNNPWDAFPTVQQQNTSQPGGPVYSPPAQPHAPNPGVGYKMLPNGTAAPIPGGPADPNANTVQTPGNISLTGEDYLKTLDPGLAGQVRALSEGRRAFPTGTALKDPKIQELVAAATQFDPTLDAANAATRVATRKDFTSGVTARNITSLNTALGHLGSLKQAADALDNRAFPLWNSLANAVETATGDKRVKEFTIARDAVANELMRVFRGAGSGSMQEIEEWKNSISSSDSPEQLHAEIAKAVELLSSRLQSLGDQYNRGMGQSKDPITLLSPHAQEVYNSLTGGGPTGGDSPPPLGPGGPTPFDSNPGGGQTVATGASRSVFEPAVAAGLNAMVQHGRPYEEAAAFAAQHGFPAPSPQEYAAALEWQRTHPNSPYDAANPTRQVQTTTLQRVAGSPIGAAGIAAGDAASGFTLDNIVGATGGDAEQTRRAIEASARNSPVASAIGTVVGGAAAALGGEAALGRAGMAAGLPRALAADTAYGAAAGAGGTDQGNRLAGAATGAAAGLAGSFLGNKAGNALAGIGRGVADQSVNALRNEGINALTIGQTYGNSGRIGAAIKGVEDRLSGLPVVGTAVKSRQAEGYRQFNSRAFDKALEPIGGKVAGKTGEDAIQSAQQQVSQAFTKALAGKGAAADDVFVRDLGASVAKATNIKKVGGELKDELGAIFQPYADEPLLSGEALDDISRSLRELKGRYARSSDPVASGPRVAKAIDDVERSVFDLFDRQASGTIPEYRAARQAYRRLSILEDAVNKARNQKERIFTPAQLGQADRGNAVKFTGRRQAAAGGSPFFDLQTAAQDVLPNKVPDSGTAGRLLVPLALIGGGGGADKLTGETGAGLTIGTILALAYSKNGQRLLTKPGRGISNEAIRRVLESDKTRRAIAAGGAATGASLATQ